MSSKYEAKIEWRDISTVTPYGRNAKTHPDAQIAKIAASIAEFGFDQPIVVDAKGVIIKGHGRREGALKLGLKQIPVIVRTDLTPTQVKASRLADNRIAESPWDNDLLSTEMGELFEEDFKLELTGFDPGEIANLFGIELDPDAEPGDSKTKEIDTDEFQMACRCPRCDFEFDPKTKP